MNKRIITDLSSNPYTSSNIGHIITVELEEYSKMRKINNSYCCTPITSDLIHYIKKNKHKQVKLVEIEKIEINDKKKRNKELFMNQLSELINSYDDAIIAIQISNLTVPINEKDEEYDVDMSKLELFNILKYDFGFEYAIHFNGYHKSIPLLLGTGVESRKIVRDITYGL